MIDRESTDRVLDACEKLDPIAVQEVVQVHPTWAKLVCYWDEMTRIYERDLATGKSDELYDLMQKLLEREPTPSLRVKGRGKARV